MDQTPVINGRTDPRRFLKLGDEVKVWVEKISFPTTTIVAKQ